MSKVLLVSSSLAGEGSTSRRLAQEFVAAWRASHPGTAVTERVLTAETMPHLDAPVLAAWAGGESAAANAALAEALTAEVEAADTIVIAAPMYNFTIPSTLKAWIDHIARAGRTFRYTAAGPEGLLKGKKVFVVTGRGGVYSGEAPAKAYDFQEPYLRAVLGFLGLTDVNFIHVEGLKLGEQQAAEALARARRSIDALAGAPLAA
ncbi:MAG: FMN-dependent NADH-azoreductase [Rhodospirillaceae bacterium]|nr:FMN-dependent NADH-azoreductase [Rhodospirillaceae bacterium]